MSSPLSSLRALRTYVNQGGTVQRRLELALTIVLSSTLLAGSAQAWHPEPHHIEEVVAKEPNCDHSLVDHIFESAFRAHDASEGSTPSIEPSTLLEPYRTCLRDDAVLQHRRDAWLTNMASRGETSSVRWLLGTNKVAPSALTAALAKADAYPDIVSLLRAAGAKDPTLIQATEAHAVHAVARLLEQNTYETEELSQGFATVLRARGMFQTHDRASEFSLIEEHEREELRVLKLFLARGAKANSDAFIALSGRGETLIEALLDSALANRSPGAIEGALGRMSIGVPETMARRLAAQGVDWGYRDGEDDAAMPLVSAVNAKNEALVRVLVELGAPVNKFYKDGSSALQAALSCDESEVCGRLTELLLAHGADANRRFPDGSTPLFTAAESGNGRAIRALLDRGARIDDRVVRETPLDAAERTNNTIAARILSARGARLAPQKP